MPNKTKILKTVGSIIGIAFLVLSSITLTSDLFLRDEPTSWGELLKGSTYAAQIASPIVVLFLSLGLIRWYLLRPPKARINDALTDRARSWGWAAYFVLAALLFVAAAVDWLGAPADNIFENATLRAIYLIVFLGAFVIEFVIIKYVRRVSWFRMLVGAGDFEPRDEREWSLAHTSASLAFGLTALTTLLLMAVLLITPEPSKSAVFNLFMGFVLLQMGFRSFFAWFFSTRALAGR